MQQAGSAAMARMAIRLRVRRYKDTSFAESTPVRSCVWLATRREYLRILDDGGPSPHHLWRQLNTTWLDYEQYDEESCD